MVHYPLKYMNGYNAHGSMQQMSTVNDMFRWTSGINPTAFWYHYQPARLTTRVHHFIWSASKPYLKRLKMRFIGRHYVASI